MKQIVMTALVLLALVFLLPVLLFGGGEEGVGPLSFTETPTPTLKASTLPAPDESIDEQQTVTLYHTESGQTETLTMDTYLWGVVAAEMPASFRIEALKAQCVAARTYALRKGSGVTADHPDAMVCDDITCCQAYLGRNEAEANWSTSAAFYADKISRAVSETDGLVITYDGALIDAVFHSSSQGYTADAAEVWGASVPYLVPVSTPEGEEVPNFHTTVTVSLSDFTSAIQSIHPEASFGADYTAWFGSPTYTAAGAVDILPTGGVDVSGLEYRSLFGLRSARFLLFADQSGVTFQVTGYGHGVGMSQYGANAMAESGEEFRQILKHYYTGCDITERR